MIIKDIQAAADLLKQELIVAIPTETVYGLAGNAYSDKAVRSIFEIKRRPADNPLIVHIGNLDQLDEIATDIPEKAMQLAAHFWPGPLTLLLKKKSTISGRVTAGSDRVAVRIPNHPVALELLSRLDFPLAAPSANPFGSISPTSAQHVARYFSGTVAAILDGGNCISGLESTIVGFMNEEATVYRLGGIPIEEIEHLTGGNVETIGKGNKTVTPGMHPRHYAPDTAACLTDDVMSTITLNSGKRIGLLLFKDTKTYAVDHIETLSPQGDLREAARNLYASLHRLDASGVELIIMEKMPDTGLGRTINERLTRAIVVG